MTQEPPKPGDEHVEPARARTGTADFQTELALDRTMLAWVRTTLSMAGFGFGMVAFFRTLRQEAPSAESVRLHLAAIRFGTALLILSIVATILAGVSHWFSLRRLRHGDPPVLRQWPLSITVAVSFAVLGLIALWVVFEQ
jgi:putative membrane protein